jgi:hypothetical protein
MMKDYIAVTSKSLMTLRCAMRWQLCYWPVFAGYTVVSSSNAEI